MKIINYILVFFLCVLFSACLSTNKTSSTSTYSENISGYRPQFDNVAEENKKDTTQIITNDQAANTDKDVTASINEIIDEVIKRNEGVDYVNGYTIQVYSGPSRENADELKAEIYKQIPDARPKTTWVAPNYKVHVGSFMEKIEAQKSYSEIKTHFPQAILIPTRIPNSVFSSKNK